MELQPESEKDPIDGIYISHVPMITDYNYISELHPMHNNFSATS